jgi:hypothetical protein
MTDELNGKPPASYYVIAVTALLWNLFGVMMYVMQVSATPEALTAAYSPDQVAMLLAVPSWATSATAVATNCGVLGCLFLLLRKSWASWMFVISLAALVVQDIYLFVMTDTAGAFGTFPLYLQTAIFIVAIGLLWYSRSVANRYYR